MRGIIIAGGEGTRLRPLTLTRPKPLIPIVSSPLVAHQLHYLKRAGITDVCFATNYMSDEIQRVLGNGSDWGMDISYAVERAPLDTGGAIRNAFDSSSADDCVILNGDVIHSFQISEILGDHRSREADVTIVVRPVETPHPYGVVTVDSNQRVTGFNEPSDEEKRDYLSVGNPENKTELMNAGIYVVNRATLEEFPVGRSKVERDVFPKLIASGKKMCANIQTGFWVDVGRPKQYLEAVQGVVRGLASAPTPFRKVGDSAVHISADVSPHSRIEGDSSVAAGVTVSDGVVISSSAIFFDAFVGAGSRIENSIVDEGARIGSNCKLAGAIVEAKEIVPDGAELGGAIT